MRIIAHIDMDAFFASIEERDKPRLKGLPVVVGSDPKDGKSRGVVSTANYKAREFGIRSALPISTAWRYAEEARLRGEAKTVFITPNMGKYADVSARIMNMLRTYAETIEEAGIDEAYIDLSAYGSYAKAIAACKKIRRAIAKAERLTASVGIGPNKLVAKIASDMNKPDGLTAIPPEDVADTLGPLPIRKLPGVGPKTEEILTRQGIGTIRQLREMPVATLRTVLGKAGQELYEKAHGEDAAPLITEWTAQSVGEQETLETDSLDAGVLFALLERLADRTYARFKEQGFSTFRTVGITVRFEGFETKTRSHTFGDPCADQKMLAFEAMRMLAPFLDMRENPGRKRIRLLGVKLEKLAVEKTAPATPHLPYI